MIKNVLLSANPKPILFSISPSIGGISQWDGETPSSLTFTTTQEYTITNIGKTVDVYFIVDGAGSYNGRVGGRSVGTIRISSGAQFTVYPGARSGSINGGGAASAIYPTSDANTPWLVAGGAGGWGSFSGGYGYAGGRGGGSTGESGVSGDASRAIGGGPGTQSAGGAGGYGDRGSGLPGSFRAGGGAGGNSTTYAGGVGWASGGYGRLNSGDGYQGGGGGGYYGGGGGGASYTGSGGGSGSGYVHPTLVSGGSTTLAGAAGETALVYMQIA